MATIVVTLKIMPEGTDTNLDELQERAGKMISDFGGEVGKAAREPVAFGLVSLVLIFTMDESVGATDELEKNIGRLDSVSSVEVTDVRRAIG